MFRVLGCCICGFGLSFRAFNWLVLLILECLGFGDLDVSGLFMLVVLVVRFAGCMYLRVCVGFVYGLGLLGFSFCCGVDII